MKRLLIANETVRLGAEKLGGNLLAAVEATPLPQGPADRRIMQDLAGVADLASAQIGRMTVLSLLAASEARGISQLSVLAGAAWGLGEILRGEDEAARAFARDQFYSAFTASAALPPG